MFSRTLAMTFGSLALASMSLITSPATLDAQSRPVNRIRFAAMDRNNDGVISRQEWNGSARSFEVHDWNNDGRLSGNEVRSGAQRDTDLADHNPNTFERNFIVRALEKCGWNVTATSEYLGVPLSTLKYKMDKLEVRQLARRIRGV